MRLISDNKVPAVVLGMTANGLSVSRSLGRKGIKVIGIDFNARQPGLNSCYCREKRICPDPGKAPADFIRCLSELGKQYEKKRPILIVTADEFLRTVSAERKRLRKYFRFNLPSPEIVETFLDKRKAFHRAKDLGFSCPVTYFVEKEEDLDLFIRKLKFPCCLKPAFSHLWKQRFGSKKLVVVESEAELRREFRQLTSAGQKMMIQELIPGRDDRIFTFLGYYDQKSQPLALFSKRKLRQYPINFGIGCMHVSEYNSRILEMGDAFCRKLGYTGFVGIEFKEDSRDGMIKFVEANLRTLMSNELAVASGVDLPYICYRDLIGMPQKTAGFRPGVKLVNLELDITSFFRYRQAGELSFREWLSSFQGKVAHTYFARDDLLPFFMVIDRFISGKLKFAVRTASANIPVFMGNILKQETSPQSR